MMNDHVKNLIAIRATLVANRRELARTSVSIVGPSDIRITNDISKIGLLRDVQEAISALDAAILDEQAVADQL